MAWRVVGKPKRDRYCTRGCGRYINRNQLQSKFEVPEGAQVKHIHHGTVEIYAKKD